MSFLKNGTGVVYIFKSLQVPQSLSPAYHGHDSGQTEESQTRAFSLQNPKPAPAPQLSRCPREESGAIGILSPVSIICSRSRMARVGKFTSLCLALLLIIIINFAGHLESPFWSTDWSLFIKEHFLLSVFQACFSLLLELP